MFSPKVHTARRKLLGAILDTPESNPASLDCQEPAERDIIDPELLAGADQAAFYDLKELEEQYENYMSKPFNFSTLMFLTDKILPPGFAPDSISLFKLLIPGHSSTQHLAYKLQGLRSISLQLTNVGCGHPSLIEHCDSLINAVNLDIQSLVLAAWKQRSSQHAHRNMIAQDNIQCRDLF
ncbi:hypothetical protein FS749_011697 [Ceratobasidium sp. UAMH 11750]|nr:hypothetical protein FS749_011697 [Ceratobasidium sp. UAMH 11750]